MSFKARKEIKISEPYFILLGQKNTKNNLRKVLIKDAPNEVFSVLTQTSRHILNGTFCINKRKFCDKYQNSLYLFSLPSTSRKDKEKILAIESFEFVRELYLALKKELEEK